MKTLRFARGWWLIALIAAGVLAAASPASGRVAEPAVDHDWTVSQTPNPGYYGNIVRGVTARTASDAWAVGVQATETSNDTLALHWDGRSWTTVPTPNPWPECQDGDILWSGNVLSAVDAVSANDVWAVGSECYSTDTIIEHWNGSSWSLVPGARHKDGFESTAALYDVAAISPSNVWAVGYRGVDTFETLVEHFNGTTWSEVPAAGGASGYLSSISATGPNDVWAVGSNDDGNIIEHFNGTAWSVVPSPQPGSGSSIRSVSALSPTNAWAVGTKTGFGSRASTFTLHWNGSVWSEVPSPNPRDAADATNELRDVVAISSANVWAVGTYENVQTGHQDRTLTMHWDGSSWSIVASPTPGATAQLTALAVAPKAPAATAEDIFVGGFFSLYEKNIYDGHYTLPQTLVLR